MTAIINIVKQKLYHFTSEAKSYRLVLCGTCVFYSSEGTDKSEDPKTIVILKSPGPGERYFNQQF